MVPCSFLSSTGSAGTFRALLVCIAFFAPRDSNAFQPLPISQIARLSYRLPSTPGKAQNCYQLRREISGSTLTNPKLHLLPSSETLSSITGSLFNYNGNVPLWQAFGINAVLFGLLRKTLLKVLTPAGFIHALALGTGLWTTLGWRGWSLCVAYLFLGSAVTKVKFAEKEKKGIAEARGGRRGPENLWYVMKQPL